MAYLIEITERAERDFASLYEEIHAGYSEAAMKWYRGLRKAVLSLEKLPNRCPPTNENPQFRHLLYGRKPHVYRVIYRVLEREKRVEVLHIRHGARRGFEAADLEQGRLKTIRPV
jgi:plasmid stabilization system protein ParE